MTWKVLISAPYAMPVIDRYRESRRVALTRAVLRANRWQEPQLFRRREKTLRGVGVGNCGRAVVRAGVGFGMRVLGSDSVEISPERLYRTGIGMVAFPALVKEADV